LRTKLDTNNVNRDELKKRITDMSTFLKKQPTALTEYDEQLVRRLIEKVTIYEDKFTVEFKSGVTVDVNE
jgi:site-specific DNA recombinase